MSWRMTPESKAKLDTAAAQSGKSLGQELEQRLEASFQDERRLGDALDLAFGEQLSALLMLLAATMHDVRRVAHYFGTMRIEPQPNWMADPFTYDQVTKAVNLILEAFRPGGDRVPDHLKESDPGNLHEPSNIGLQAAGTYLVAVADPNAEDPVHRIGRKTREKLGEAAMNRVSRYFGVNREDEPADEPE
jgi:hypothetical protein